MYVTKNEKDKQAEKRTKDAKQFFKTQWVYSPYNGPKFHGKNPKEDLQLSSMTSFTEHDRLKEIIKVDQFAITFEFLDHNFVNFVNPH